MLSSSSDLDLAHAVCEGSEAAFRELLSRHLQPLRAFLSLRVPVPDLIDEVAHDAFVLAHRRMDSFKENSMQPWLRAIAQNILRDRLKSFARETVRRERYGDQLRLDIAHGSSYLPISNEAEYGFGPR